MGASEQRLNALKSQNSSDALTLQENLSNVEEPDLTQATMQLQMQQNAYEAALAVTAPGDPTQSRELPDQHGGMMQATSLLTDAPLRRRSTSQQGFPGSRTCACSRSNGGAATSRRS